MEDEPVPLHGIAVDPQDGAISGDVLVWTSDAVEEVLWIGNGPFSTLLPVGKQIITLTAGDSDGNVATRKLQIYIKAKPVDDE